MYKTTVTNMDIVYNKENGRNCYRKNSDKKLRYCRLVLLIRGHILKSIEKVFRSKCDRKRVYFLLIQKSNFLKQFSIIVLDFSFRLLYINHKLVFD